MSQILLWLYDIQNRILLSKILKNTTNTHKFGNGLFSFFMPHKSKHCQVKTVMQIRRKITNKIIQFRESVPKLWHIKLLCHSGKLPSHLPRVEKVAVGKTTVLFWILFMHFIRSLPLKDHLHVATHDLIPTKGYLSYMKAGHCIC